MTPDEYLAVPYVLTVDSIRRPDGTWVRRAEYPEIGCVGEGATLIEAVDQVEEIRVRYILERLEQGEAIPVPRPPLRSSGPALDLERLVLAERVGAGEPLKEA